MAATPGQRSGAATMGSLGYVSYGDVPMVEVRCGGGGVPDAEICALQQQAPRVAGAGGVLGTVVPWWCDEARWSRCGRRAAAATKPRRRRTPEGRMKIFFPLFSLFLKFQKNYREIVFVDFFIQNLLTNIF